MENVFIITLTHIEKNLNNAVKAAQLSFASKINNKKVSYSVKSLAFKELQKAERDLEKVKIVQYLVMSKNKASGPAEKVALEFVIKILQDSGVALPIIVEAEKIRE